MNSSPAEARAELAELELLEAQAANPKTKAATEPESHTVPMVRAWVGMWLPAAMKHEDAKVKEVGLVIEELRDCLAHRGDPGELVDVLMLIAPRLVPQKPLKKSA